MRIQGFAGDNAVDLSKDLDKRFIVAVGKSSQVKQHRQEIRGELY